MQLKKKADSNKKKRMAKARGELGGGLSRGKSRRQKN
jgi:hypothetical protein